MMLCDAHATSMSMCWEANNNTLCSMCASLTIKTKKRPSNDKLRKRKKKVCLIALYVPLAITTTAHASTKLMKWMLIM